MAKVFKTLDRILRGIADANLRFADLCALLVRLGFDERVRGDHHIFTKEGVEEILNLQPRGHQAKAYQVKQVRSVIVVYGLADDSTVVGNDDSSNEDEADQSQGNGTDEQ